MIHLCYLKNDYLFESDRYLQGIDHLMNRLDGSDLIIADKSSHDKIKNRYEYFYKYSQPTNYPILTDASHIDFEKLSNQSLNNIVILNFNSIESSIIRQIINQKSIKAEIIGVTNSFVDCISDNLVEIEQYKDKGFSLDEISVLMVLKENKSSEVVNACIKEFKFYKNSKFKIINSMKEITKLIKHPEQN